MNQREAVIRTMAENDGIATLGYLYQNALKVKKLRGKRERHLPASAELFKMINTFLGLNQVCGR
jgi:hypothetical protein